MNDYISNKGATLIEILISLAVISVGIIGVAALQVTQLYQVSQTNLNYIISQQVMDIADRIRANPVGADTGAYNAITGSSSCSSTSEEPPATISNDCSSSCSPTELATFDAMQWNQNNATLLPNGSGTITSSDGENFTITLMWCEKAGSKENEKSKDSGAQKTFTVSMTL